MRETVRREILPDVWMTSTRTDSYRTGFFSVLLVTELKRDTAAKNALLPRVLRRGTAEYPDVRAVSEALDELYGGEISPVAVTWGELQGVGFVSRFTDEALLPGKPKITEKMIRLVGGMLLDPMTRGGKSWRMPFAQRLTGKWHMPKSSCFPKCARVSAMR